MRYADLQGIFNQMYDAYCHMPNDLEVCWNQHMIRNSTTGIATSIISHFMLYERRFQIFDDLFCGVGSTFT